MAVTSTEHRLSLMAGLDAAAGARLCEPQRHRVFLRVLLGNVRAPSSQVLRLTEPRSGGGVGTVRAPSCCGSQSRAPADGGMAGVSRCAQGGSLKVLL